MLPGQKMRLRLSIVILIVIAFGYGFAEFRRATPRTTHRASSRGADPCDGWDGRPGLADAGTLLSPAPEGLPTEKASSGAFPSSRNAAGIDEARPPGPSRTREHDLLPTAARVRSAGSGARGLGI